MTDYVPDKWVVIQITTNDASHYKVFGSWYGGYLSGDSWRLNSGIKSISLKENLIVFNGFSGSKYYCHKDSYGMSGYSGGVMSGFIDKASEKNVDIVLLNEDTDWLNLVGQKC